MTTNGFFLEGEGAGVYDAALGLKRYMRRLTMKATGKIDVLDTVETSSPRAFAEVFHSDAKLQQIAERQYRTEIHGAILNLHLLEPVAVTSQIEQNIVMGPGKPGSVDKGSLEPRGERLVVSTDKKEMSTKFAWELLF